MKVFPSPSQLVLAFSYFLKNSLNFRNINSAINVLIFFLLFVFQCCLWYFFSLYKFFYFCAIKSLFPCGIWNLLGLGEIFPTPRLQNDNHVFFCYFCGFLFYIKILTYKVCLNLRWKVVYYTFCCFCELALLFITL